MASETATLILNFRREFEMSVARFIASWDEGRYGEERLRIYLDQIRQHPIFKAFVWISNEYANEMAETNPEKLLAHYYWYFQEEYPYECFPFLPRAIFDEAEHIRRHYFRVLTEVMGIHAPLFEWDVPAVNIPPKEHAVIVIE